MVYKGEYGNESTESCKRLVRLIIHKVIAIQIVCEFFFITTNVNYIYLAEEWGERIMALNEKIYVALN